LVLFLIYVFVFEHKKLIFKISVWDELQHHWSVGCWYFETWWWSHCQGSGCPVWIIQ